uniref:Uncharacterized protein n=1 Tax=Moniliophthora roreri TaxID=221103 RepID=A0A0W0GAL6_MONRR
MSEISINAKESEGISITYM